MSTKHENLPPAGASCGAIANFSPDRPSLKNYSGFFVKFASATVSGIKLKVEFDICKPENAQVPGQVRFVIDDAYDVKQCWWHYPSSLALEGHDFGIIYIEEDHIATMKLKKVGEHPKWPSGGGIDQKNREQILEISTALAEALRVLLRS